MQYKRIAVDTSKAVFTLYGVNDQERPLLQRNLKRAELETFFSTLAIATLDQRIEALEEELLAVHKALPVSQRLIAVPGIGPITAITLALSVEPRHFASGRHFAAWLGLTPKEHSTGGKPRLGKISKAGNERLRTLLVVGAMAVIRHARPGRKGASAWLLQLLGRKPRKLAAVALANKMARIAWAMMVRGEAYRHAPIAA
jgi:transposase